MLQDVLLLQYSNQLPVLRDEKVPDAQGAEHLNDPVQRRLFRDLSAQHHPGQHLMLVWERARVTRQRWAHTTAHTSERTDLRNRRYNADKNK